MGFWKVVGTVGKGALKFAGYMVNEISKQTIGIDFAEETKGMREAYTESTYINKEIKELERNRDEYIQKYGREAYESELELLKLEAQDLVDMFKDELSYASDKVRDYNDRRAVMNDAQEKIKKMKDEQILRYLRKTDIKEGIRCLLEQEKRARGI